MPTFTRNSPPNWLKGIKAVKTSAGWVHPRTGELLVAYKTPLTVFGNAPTVLTAKFNRPSYKTGDTIKVLVDFSEPVVVTGGVPTLVLSIGGTSRTATYIGKGSKSKARLTFYYTVVSGDVAVAGGVLFPTAVALNGATLVSSIVAPVEATLVSGTSNSALTVLANAGGVSGNSITLTVVAGTGNNATTTWAASGNALTLTLGTNGSAVVNATVNQAIAALVSSAPASVLVSANAGVGNGTGVMVAATVVNLAGGSASGSQAGVLNVASGTTNIASVKVN